MKLALRRASIASPGARDARRAWPEREWLWLRLTDTAGHSGLAEAAPLPGYSSDRLDDIEAWLARFDANRLTEALESPSVRQALLLASALVPPALPGARMALETAVLDLLGQRRRLPAHSLLKSDDGPLSQRPVCALLGPADASELVASAHEALTAGYRCLKLKLGAPGRIDAEVLGVERLRAAVGPEPALRLDANGALVAQDLARVWPRLESFGVELFEEPGPSQLPSGLPLALDESLQGLAPMGAARRARQRSARAVVLKPTVLGGLAHCAALAEAARSFGIDAVVTHSFDGPCGFAAAAALALALPNVRSELAHGLAPHAALGAWRERAPIKSGKLEPWTLPGLGLGELEGAP